MAFLKIFAAYALFVSLSVSAYVLPDPAHQDMNAAIADSTNLLYVVVFNSSQLTDAINQSNDSDNAGTQTNDCAQQTSAQYAQNMTVIGGGMDACMNVSQVELDNYFATHSAFNFQLTFELDILACTRKDTAVKEFNCFVDALGDALNHISKDNTYEPYEDRKNCLAIHLHDFAKQVQDEPSIFAQCYDNQPSDSQPWLLAR